MENSTRIQSLPKLKISSSYLRKETPSSKVTLASINEILGLNTFEISLAHIDFVPYGLNPHHTHLEALRSLMS